MRSVSTASIIALSLTVVLSAGAVRAQDEPTPEELEALAAAVAADAETTESSAPAPAAAPSRGGGSQSMNPDIAVILDTAFAWFEGEAPMQLGAHDPNENGFNLQQLELSIGAAVDHVLRFDANLVFAQFGVEVEEAYATTLAMPAGLQLRAGQFLTRFGRLNPTHPHSWSFVDQPLVNGKMLGGEGSRGLGAEMSWLVPLPWYVEILVSSTDAAGECCARSFFGGDDPGVESPTDLLYTTALRQFFELSDSWGLQLGLSTQLGPNATGNDNRSEIYGADLYLRWRPVASVNRTAVSFTLEAMHRRRQVPDDVLVDTGGYAQLVWNITPAWEVGARGEYVEGVESDPTDPEWTEARHRQSVQATWYPSHFSRVRLQGSHDRPEWLDGPIWGTFLALEVVVGAHGAHTY